MDKIINALKFLGVMDGTKLSLTKLAFIALTIKMLFAPELDWPAVLTFLGVLLSYMHKRATQPKKAPASDTDGLKALVSEAHELAKDAQSKLSRLAIASGFKNLTPKE